MFSSVTRLKKVWLTVLITAAGLAAVAIWTGSRTTAIYAGAALQRASSAHDREMLLRSYEQEITAVRSTLFETTVCSVGIVILLAVTVALLWSRENDVRRIPNDLHADDLEEQKK